MFLSRRSRAVLVTASALLLAGCGDAGGLRGAGATPTAVGPARLWPEQPPASSPAWDYGEAETETVKGVEVPGDDIREVDPVAVVRAEIDAHPDQFKGPSAPYGDTTSRMTACEEQGTVSGRGDRCPVLQAYYRDLTGDGRDELVLGIELVNQNLTAVRVYIVDRHRLVQIMANDDSVTAVELAGHALIIRSPSQIAGYEYRTQWTWDADQKAMLLTRDEFLRTDKDTDEDTGKDAGKSTATPSPSPR
ncbi:hypothetical protein [Streptomyces sp. NPDC002845]